MSRHRSNLLLGLAIIAALFGIASLGMAIHSFFPAAPQAPITPALRDPMPLNMAILNGEGRRFSTADAKGRPIVLNYFATWCEPCNDEMPGLAAIAKEFPQVTFAAISLDTPDPKRNDLLNSFTTKFALPFPILLPDTDSPSYRMDEIPQTFVLDADGKIAFHDIGEISDTTLRQHLQQLLK